MLQMMLGRQQKDRQPGHTRTSIQYVAIRTHIWGARFIRRIMMGISRAIRAHTYVDLSHAAIKNLMGSANY